MTMRRVLLIKWILFLLAVTTLDANWKEMIKPCENKGEGHLFGGVDFIYMINLSVRPKKWERSQTQLASYGIYPYRFDAVNGWDLAPASFAHLGCPELARGMTPGKIGCCLSFLSVFFDAYNSGYETIWVMEDDIDVMEDPRQIPDLIRELDQVAGDWDILYTDIDTKDYFGKRVPCLDIYPRPNFTPLSLEFYRRRIPINENFEEIGMRFGCYSMIIRRAGLEKILRYFDEYQMYLPIDMELFFVPGLKQIVLTRDVISTLPGVKSDTNSHYQGVSE